MIRTSSAYGIQLLAPRHEMRRSAAAARNGGAAEGYKQGSAAFLPGAA
jgi:hypothetical protein